MIDVGCQFVDGLSEEHNYSDVSRMTEHGYCGSKQRCASSQVKMSFYSSLKCNRDYKFYTGITERVFNDIVRILRPFNKRSHLCLEDQLLLTLMRIKLGLLFTDLGKRFSISTAAASSLFSKWVPIMARELGRVIIWLSKEIIQATLPETFKSQYPNITCIIDSSEIFLQRPTLLRSKTGIHNRYVAHSTVKFLIAIAPSGFIMFISKSYEGHTFEQTMVRESGFLQHISPGDKVMADCRFPILEDLAVLHATLIIPTQLKALTTEKKSEVLKSRRVRIRVETAIAKLKSFNLIKFIYPIPQKSLLDDIIVICCSLCNLQNEKYNLNL
ncbi:hypothetical protein CHUAL_014106 [Chamberlinius hualienensis]